MYGAVVITTTATTNAHRIGRNANARRSQTPAAGVGFIRENITQNAVRPPANSCASSIHWRFRPSRPTPPIFRGEIVSASKISRLRNAWSGHGC